MTKLPTAAIKKQRSNRVVGEFADMVITLEEHDCAVKGERGTARLVVRANGFPKMGKRWEGEAPTEPQHTLPPQLASRLRGSVALP